MTAFLVSTEELILLHEFASLVVNVSRYATFTVSPLSKVQITSFSSIDASMYVFKLDVPIEGTEATSFELRTDEFVSAIHTFCAKDSSLGTSVLHFLHSVPRFNQVDAIYLHKTARFEIKDTYMFLRDEKRVCRIVLTKVPKALALWNIPFPLEQYRLDGERMDLLQSMRGDVLNIGVFSGKMKISGGSNCIWYSGQNHGTIDDEKFDAATIKQVLDMMNHRVSKCPTFIEINQFGFLVIGQKYAKGEIIVGIVARS